MQSRGKGFKRWLRRWCDAWKLAWSGVVLATRQRSFLIAFVLSFVIFGTLMSLLSSSTAPLAFFWSDSLTGKLRTIFQGFISIFMIDGSFWSWLLRFLVILCQSILIGLVTLVWQKRRRSRKAQVVATATNVDNVEHAGVAAGLAVLGSGCPTCGTSLLMPLLGTTFSTGGLIFATILMHLLTIAALIISLLSIKKLGYDAYAYIASERFQKRHAAEAKSDSSALSDVTVAAQNASAKEVEKTKKIKGTKE